MLEVFDLHAHSEESADQAADRLPLAARGRVLECAKPDCGSEDVRPCRSFKRPKKIPVQFRCRTCGHRFTVRDNYFLSDSTIPLRVWLWALYLVEATSEQVGRKSEMRQQSGLATTRQRLTRTHFPGAECQKQDFPDLTDYQDCDHPTAASHPIRYIL